MQPMPPLPELPLVDGHLLLDNSAIEKMKCPRLFEYEHLRRRTLTASKSGRNFGSTLHQGFAVRYQQCLDKAVTPEVSQLVNTAMREWLETHPQPWDDFRNYHLAVRIMEKYNEVYGVEPFKIIRNHKGEPIVEHSFALPFGVVSGIPVVYIGKIDLAVEDNYGYWAGPDHKSSSIIGIPLMGKVWEQQMQVDGGQMGYSWALKQVLGFIPNGYIIDAIRVRRPKKGDDFNENREGPVDKSDFYRFNVFITEEDLEDWYEDTVHIIETIIFHSRRGYFPRHRWNCTNKFGTCDMYDVCSLRRHGRADALFSNIYEDATWSPLKQEKQERVEQVENKESEETNANASSKNTSPIPGG